jgi:hypothetical protein
MKNDRVDELPIFWAHGTSDAVIKSVPPFSLSLSIPTMGCRFEKGKGAADTLIESGLSKVTFKSYTGTPPSLLPSVLRTDDELKVWDTVTAIENCMTCKNG